MINSDELEAERAIERISEIQSIIKIAFYKMAFPIGALFLIPDWFLVHDKFEYLFWDRAVLLAIGFICIYLVNRVRNQRQAQLVGILGVFLVGFEVDAAIWIAQSSQYYNFVGLLLVTMCSSFFIPFQPIYWFYSVIGTYAPFFLGLYFYFGKASDLPWIFSNVVYIISTLIIAYFINQFNEALRRRALASRLALKREVETRDQIIAEKTKEALALELEAQESRIISDIARQVSHDIRSPISAMNLVVGSLKDLPAAKIQLLKDSVQRVNDIANDLLSRSKNVFRQNTSTISALRFRDLHRIADDVLNEKRLQFQKTMIDFDLQGATDHEGFVSIEPVRFKRIISNLINNSIEALGEQGRIEIVIAKASDDLIFEIRDNGRGIPMDILPKLMTEGFSFGKNNGNGLGLYSAKRDIESWGGSVRITSAIDSGTTVSIRLPLRD